MVINPSLQHGSKFPETGGPVMKMNFIFIIARAVLIPVESWSHGHHSCCPRRPPESSPNSLQAPLLGPFSARAGRKRGVLLVLSCGALVTGAIGWNSHAGWVAGA